jgi:hypothetical protein
VPGSRNKISIGIRSVARPFPSMRVLTQKYHLPTPTSPPRGRRGESVIP